VMPKSASKQPLNWEDYEYGRSPRQGSDASLSSHVQFDESSPSATSGRLNVPQRNGSSAHSHGDLHDLRARRCVTLFPKNAPSSSRATMTLTVSCFHQDLRFRCE